MTRGAGGTARGILGWRAARALILVCAICVACAAACSDAPSGRARATSPAPPPVGIDASVASPLPTRAVFGLDERPTNATCRAPARPLTAGGAAVKLERAFTGVTFHRPIAMAQRPGDGSRWFVAQRDGVIVSFLTTSPPAEPPIVVDVPRLAGRPIRADFEGGLLNFVFHPDFAHNGRAYVSFTTDGAASGSFASEIGVLTSTDNGASFTSYAKVLGFDRPRLEHNGGGMAFGTDGLLYLGFGDGVNDRNAQNKEIFFGKILRIDVDRVPAGATYGIPASNPFNNGGGRREIFAWGFRNPFRISIDRATGDLWEGDVGDATWEEVNRVELGANHGWPCREGKHDHLIDDALACPSKLGLVDPIVEHRHPTPNSRSVTGGVVYRGAAIPSFQGTYVYADFIQLEAWALSFDPATGQPRDERINDNGPSAGFSTFTEDSEGEMYALALFQDAVFKLVRADSNDAGVGSDVPGFPQLLSQTGCVDALDPTRPSPGVVPYTVNAALFSDGADDKERFFAVPDGAAITTGADGDLDLPVGSVAMKTFSLGGKRVETRLFVHHEDGDWAGYSYEWDEAQTEARLLVSGKTKSFGARSWSYPSRGDCMRCHTTAAGRTLGLELGQLDGDFVYASTNRVANQVKTLEHIGLLSTAGAVSAPYPSPFGGAPLEARARSYLHANCAGCHRPGGGAARSSLDLRFATSLADTSACGTAPQIDDLGIFGASLVAPGSPATSVLSRRMHAVDGKRMPPLGRSLVDERGTSVVDDWIRSIARCP